MRSMRTSMRGSGRTGSSGTGAATGRTTEASCTSERTVTAGGGESLEVAGRRSVGAGRSDRRSRAGSGRAGVAPAAVAPTSGPSSTSEGGLGTAAARGAARRLSRVGSTDSRIGCGRRAAAARAVGSAGDGPDTTVASRAAFRLSLGGGPRSSRPSRTSSLAPSGTRGGKNGSRRGVTAGPAASPTARAASVRRNPLTRALPPVAPDRRPGARGSGAGAAHPGRGSRVRSSGSAMRARAPPGRGDRPPA